MRHDSHSMPTGDTGSAGPVKQRRTASELTYWGLYRLFGAVAEAHEVVANALHRGERDKSAAAKTRTPAAVNHDPSSDRTAGKGSELLFRTATAVTHGLADASEAVGQIARAPRRSTRSRDQSQSIS